VITQDELKLLFRYVEGKLFRIKTVRNNAKANSHAGWTTTRGYRKIQICGKHYAEHRLVWLWFKGSFPENEIDHINHIKDDNRIENLRDVTHATNGKNQSSQPTNTSGVQGVSWYKNNKRWIAFITVDGNSIHLGSYLEFHEAVNARKNAEVLYGFHENHGNSI